MAASSSSAVKMYSDFVASVSTTAPEDFGNREQGNSRKVRAPNVKMLRNLQRAIFEHYIPKSPQKSFNTSPYASFEDVYFFPLAPHPTKEAPLAFEASSFSSQGSRPYMEDSSFYTLLDEGCIAGVFDGHRGPEVARYANASFLQNFAPTLREMNGNVCRTFRCLIDKIHIEVILHHEWDHIGSTVVVTFVDKREHMAYTATLGDSEANIYRNIDEKCKSIPLSCVRNWKSKHDALRATEALKTTQHVEDFLKKEDPKQRYFPPSGGINVSRAIGDVGLSFEQRSAISQKPKITMARTRPGDVLILTSDGLKDAVKEGEIALIVDALESSPERLAEALVNYAVKRTKAPDNITVVVMKIC